MTCMMMGRALRGRCSGQFITQPPRHSSVPQHRSEEPAHTTALLSSDDLRPTARGARVESITFSSILARPVAAPAAEGTSGPAPVWRRADDDLWVATVDGEYGGMVTRLPDGFHVHDRYTRPVGVVATLAAARRLHASPHAGSPRARRARPTTSVPGRARREGPVFAGPSHQREKTS